MLGLRYTSVDLGVGKRLDSPHWRDQIFESLSSMHFDKGHGHPRPVIRAFVKTTPPSLFLSHIETPDAEKPAKQIRQQECSFLVAANENY